MLHNSTGIDNLTHILVARKQSKSGHLRLLIKTQLCNLEMPQMYPRYFLNESIYFSEKLTNTS